MGKERKERHLGLMWIVMYELLMLGNLDVLGNLMFKLFMKWRGFCWNFWKMFRKLQKNRLMDVLRSSFKNFSWKSLLFSFCPTFLIRKFVINWGKLWKFGRSSCVKAFLSIWVFNLSKPSLLPSKSSLRRSQPLNKLVNLHKTQFLPKQWIKEEKIIFRY